MLLRSKQQSKHCELMNDSSVDRVFPFRSAVLIAPVKPQSKCFSQILLKSSRDALLTDNAARDERGGVADN